MDNFDQMILNELQDLLETDEIETLVRRSTNSNGDIDVKDAAVKMKHKPSGKECVCNEYESQIRNKAIALVRLCKELKKQ